jgi:hypothetical protein
VEELEFPCIKYGLAAAAVREFSKEEEPGLESGQGKRLGKPVWCGPFLGKPYSLVLAGSRMGRDSRRACRRYRRT